MIIVLKIKILHLSLLYYKQKYFTIKTKPLLCKSHFSDLSFDVDIPPLTGKINSSTRFNCKFLAMVNLDMIYHGIFYVLVHHVCCRSILLARNLLFWQIFKHFATLWKFFCYYHTISQALIFFLHLPIVFHQLFQKSLYRFTGIEFLEISFLL